MGDDEEYDPMDISEDGADRPSEEEEYDPMDISEDGAGRPSEEVRHGWGSEDVRHNI